MKYEVTINYKSKTIGKSDTQHFITTSYMELENLLAKAILKFDFIDLKITRSNNN